jgi:hypothetical protein
MCLFGSYIGNPPSPIGPSVYPECFSNCPALLSHASPFRFLNADIRGRGNIALDNADGNSGYCSREQAYRPEECGICHSLLTGKKGGGFWEGGKGTRDKNRMSRKGMCCLLMRGERGMGWANGEAQIRGSIRGGVVALLLGAGGRRRSGLCMVAEGLCGSRGRGSGCWLLY